MTNALFIATLGALMTAWLGWACRVLPRARWQFLAAVPLTREGPETWRGMNLTYYGLLSASAYLFALALFVVLAGSAAVERGEMAVTLAALLALCVPASRLVSKWVDGKPFGFTIGGACFLGIVVAPWMLAALGAVSPGTFENKLWPLLAALAVAYVAGEGLGRTACISFGCCYGKPLTALGPRMQRLCERFAFVFEGGTKKISYASGLEGVKVVPIQAITATLCALIALGATGFYLNANFAAAYLFAVVPSQAWRAYSETLRADWRGEGRVSAYQVMACVACVYAIGLALALGGGYSEPVAGYSAAHNVDLNAGLSALWNPGVIVVLQLVWAAIFLYMGCSMVTGSSLSFHVHRERV